MRNDPRRSEEPGPVPASPSAIGLPQVTTPTREEFEARIEALETRMDARLASAITSVIARLDAFEIRADERERRMDARFEALNSLMDERDKRLEERDKRLDERDKRLEMLAQRADTALQRTSHLSTHMWLVAATFILTTAGTVVGTYYAAQSSHVGMTQAVISAFQQGQQTQVPLKE